MEGGIKPSATADGLFCPQAGLQITGFLLLAFATAAAIMMLTSPHVAMQSEDDFEKEYGVSESEYRELLSEAEAAGAPPEADCPFKLSRSQWDELQAQFERTPALGDTWAPSGEHYILVHLLNDWNIFPKSAAEALEIAEFLLTYCMET